MKHKKFESLIVLDFYNEISPVEKSGLEKHLSTCFKCSEFQKNVGRTIPQRRQIDDSHLDATLVDARNELHRSLLASRNIPEYRFSLPERRFAPVPAYAVAAIAFVMLAIGAATSYLYFNQQGKGTGSIIADLNSRNRNDVAIDNIRFLSTDQKSGEVQFSFDFIRRYEMKGSLDDHDVQKVLAYALGNSDNAGIRLKTVGMLDAAASTKPDKGIENALIKAAETDDNAGVRREALLSLKRMPFDDEIKGALLFVLQNDKNPGMRVLAINYLSEKEMDSTSVGSKTIDPKVLNVLKEKSLSDQNQYVRLKAAGLLKEITEL
jgi:hypothetical protein